MPVVFGGHLYVFVHDTSGHVFYRRYDGATWDQWTALDGNTDADLGAAAFGGRLFLFQKTGTALHVRVFDGASWGPWTDHQATNVASSPEPIVFGGRLYVFVHEGAGATVYQVWNGTAWGIWTSIGGTTDAAPEPAVLGGTLHVFVRAFDKSLAYRTFDGTQWSTSWTTLGDSVDVVSGGG